jgi:hypothetical protein
VTVITMVVVTAIAAAPMIVVAMAMIVAPAAAVTITATPRTVRENTARKHRGNNQKRQYPKHLHGQSLIA